jgi:GNAT superfamily N-acetyltransferase
MRFADLELSRRLERTEGQSGKEFAEARRAIDPESGAAWMECAGAWAIFDGVYSPITQTFGLGLFEESDAAALDAIESFFRERGAPVVHEVSPLAGIVTVQLLCERGYRPVEFSSVMHRPVQRLDIEAQSSIRVRVTDPDEARLWAETSARGWTSEYPELRESIEQFGMLASARTNSVCFLAEFDGQPGAAGALTLHDGVALFAGAATVPELRGRGLQSALLAARMDYAFDRGDELAMMVTGVGGQSQRNAERIGFKIAYTRTKWKLGVED